MISFQFPTAFMYTYLSYSTPLFLLSSSKMIGRRYFCLARFKRTLLRSVCFTLQILLKFRFSALFVFTPLFSSSYLENGILSISSKGLQILFCFLICILRLSITLNIMSRLTIMGWGYWGFSWKHRSSPTWSFAFLPKTFHFLFRS